MKGNFRIAFAMAARPRRLVAEAENVPETQPWKNIVAFEMSFLFAPPSKISHAIFELT